MTVTREGQRNQSRISRCRKQKADPNGTRAKAAKSRNPNPCAGCQRSRQKCTGGPTCSQCLARRIPCEPGKQEQKHRISVKTDMTFIYEDGKSPPTGKRPRSNTFRTVDSVVNSTRKIEQGYHNTLSPTSPTAQWAPPVVPESVQSPTSELRSKFCLLAVEDTSGPSKCEYASGPRIHVSNEISQGQVTGFGGQTSQSMDSSSMDCNSASSSILPQTHADSEVVATTSASVSISGDTTNLGTSTFSCSTEYAQGANVSAHGSASVRAAQENIWNPPFTPNNLGTFGVNLSSSGDPVYEGFSIALESIAGRPTGLDPMPLQSAHESADTVEQDYDEYRVQQEGYLQFLQSFTFFPRTPQLTCDNSDGRLVTTNDDL